MTDRPTCETCAYYSAFVAEFVGACHRHAPKPEPGAAIGRQRWPRVSDDDWCGEFMSPEVTVVFDETSGADDNLPKTLGRAR